MKNFLLALLLIPSLCFGANGSGNVSSVKVMGGVDTLTGPITLPVNDTTRFTLYATSNSTGNPSFWVFRKSLSNNGYRVTTGKTLHCDHFNVWSSTANTGVQAAYSMTSFADAATSITSGIYMNGVTLPASNYGPLLSGAASTWRQYTKTWEAEALAYVGVNVAVNAAALLVDASCFEF